MHTRTGLAVALLLSSNMLAMAEDSKIEPPKSATGSDVRAVPAAKSAAGTDTATTTAVADITNEQKVRAGEAFGKSKVALAKDVNANLGVGDAVPQSVNLRAVPEAVTQAVPLYRNYEYFMLAEKTVVLVDTASRTVVDILAIPE